MTDDKGPAIAVIHAIKELLDEGVTFNKRVRIIFGQAEETGAWEDMEYYKKNEEAVDFGFTPDADFPAIYGEMCIRDRPSFVRFLAIHNTLRLEGLPTSWRFHRLSEAV